MGKRKIERPAVPVRPPRLNLEALEALEALAPLEASEFRDPPPKKRVRKEVPEGECSKGSNTGTRNRDSAANGSLGSLFRSSAHSADGITAGMASLQLSHGEGASTDSPA